MLIKCCRHATYPTTGYFQCKENHFEPKAITLYLFVKIYPSAIPEHSFTIWTLIPSLKEISKGMPKIESETNFLTSIKGRNSVLICQNLPICNTRTLLPNINSNSKFEENWLKNAPSREGKPCADRRTDTRTQFFEWRL